MFMHVEGWKRHT